MPALEEKYVLELTDEIMKQIYSVSSRQIMLDLLETAHREYPHEDSFIYEHLHTAFEEDIAPIKDWVEGKQGMKFPHKIERKVGSTKIKVFVTHRGKAEEIFGVDVLYEIEKKKAAGFQHKKIDRKDSLRVDKEQLKKIRQTCPICKWYSSSLRKFLLPLIPFSYRESLEMRFRESYVKPGCSAFYVINSPNLGIEGVLSACKLRDFMKKYRRNHGEIFKLLRRDTIDDAFVKCIVGYNLRYEPEGRNLIDQLYSTLFMNQHLIFEVLLSKIR